MSVKRFIAYKKRDIKKKLNILKVEDMGYWNEYDKFYSSINCKDKSVLDIGSDIGSSAIGFIRNGAKHVTGFSKDKQYFENPHYIHKQYNFEEISSIVKETKFDILKMDCEGCEWNFSIDFIKQFDDWIIALHKPIMNNELYNYIKDNGEYIGMVDNETEFATYKKKII